MSSEDNPEPVVGMTGARFGGLRRRARKRRPGGPVEPVPGAAEVTVEIAAVAERAEAGENDDMDAGEEASRMTGARFGAQRDPLGEPSSRQGPGEEHPPLDVGREPDQTSSFVRPYVYTGGRTRPQLELAIETLVSAKAGALETTAASEQRAVLELCATPTSVAEVAALLRVPLGVARVLLGDLAASGAVAVHQSAGTEGPDLKLMERVLAGLKRL